MRGGEILARAMLAGKEQTLVDRRRHRGARALGARIAVGIGAERPAIARPSGFSDRCEALAHVAAEHIGDLLDCERRERSVPFLLERAREGTAEIAVDHRPAEWA